MYYKFKKEYCPNLSHLCEWLQKMSLEGWEFVSIDYTRLTGMGDTSTYQYYIFRQPVFESTPDDTQL